MDDGDGDSGDGVFGHVVVDELAGLGFGGGGLEEGEGEEEGCHDGDSLAGFLLRGRFRFLLFAFDGSARSAARGCG